MNASLNDKNMSFVNDKLKPNLANNVRMYYNRALH
jgi:hypothetical protein